MTTELQKLTTIHAALVLELAPLAQKFADVLALAEAMGHQINAALASSDEPFAQTFDHGAEPALELACHRPSTIPPPVETNEIGAVVYSAEFAPDHDELAATLITTDPSDKPPGVELPAAKPKRAKTEYTAREWAMSPHFLHLMKRQHPFNTWTAEQQNAKRDEFVASTPPDERMNRWGQRFAKFCGVAQ